mgnify:CR=1 FL=1
MVDKNLLEYCLTERQKQVIKALLQYNTQAQAAVALNISTRVLQTHLSKVRAYASTQGYSPQHDMIHPTASTHALKGTSTLYGDKGEIKQQWVKTNLKQTDQLESLKSVLEEYLAGHVGKSPKIKTPKLSKDKHTLAVINIGDAHIGMRASEEVSGQEYNLQIAINKHKEVFLRLLNNAPDCDTCVINQLGDYYHFDNYEASTTKGTRVDVDDNLDKVFMLGLQLMTFMVEQSLKVFRKVIIRHSAGNHDRVLTIGLRAHQEAYWRNNKRVEIIMDSSPCWVYSWGKTAFLVTHGDAPKPMQLGEYFASRYPEKWGESTHRYAWHGHVHHKNVAKESYGGCITESWAGLPPADQWHDRCGYVSGQSMSLIVLDKDKGEIRRSTERV